jgi:hypothetical protein
LFPEETKDQVVEEEISRTGEDLKVVVLSPSSPFSFLPHVQRVPSVLIAAECSLPKETSHQFVDEVISRTGEHLDATVLSPSDPQLLLPQAQRVPSVFIAAELNLPVEMAHHVVEEVISRTGEDLSTTVPSPS